MAEKFITTNLRAVIERKALPGITIWNRLEGRPRAEKFDRALRAEVRDPLWMLTRQWQMGEFRGDDAGSPIFTKVRVETTRIRKYQAAQGPVEAFDDAIPLEARVEQMPIAFARTARDFARYPAPDGQAVAEPHPSAGARVVSEFIGAYPIHSPDPLQMVDAPTVAHPEAWSNFAAVANRRMDGAKFYFHLKIAGNHASDGIASLVGLETEADKVAARFIAWFEKLFYQPTAPSAWEPDRLEYQFACACPEQNNEKVFVAEEYFRGHLDWYNLDVDPSRQVLGDDPPVAEPPTPVTLTMLPTQVTFNGIPNTRWWEFEDSRTNFGDIRPDTTDLAKLLLIEFGLTCANDWFLIPFTVPSGTVATVRGIAVTNVFGERIWVEAAGRGDDDDWQRWAMFLVSIKGKRHEPADLSLVILPAAQKVLEGRPLEAVMFARDEVANMVWGVERTIPLPTGEPKRGREAADETRALFEQDLERRLGAPPEPPDFAEGAKIRYQVMNTVSENCIPMISVHVPGDNREVQLQRAAMLRIMDGDTNPPGPQPVRPRTSLLREGLDQGLGYILHEEEVPRAGALVTKSFHRTRWRDGRAWVWLGVRKQTGRGEGSSGLAFDRILNVNSET
ncbi:MAG: hypothetical protein WKF37_19000 [Bryobacteraceae bacterium]